MPTGLQHLTLTAPVFKGLAFQCAIRAVYMPLCGPPLRPPEILHRAPGLISRWRKQLKALKEAGWPAVQTQIKLVNLANCPPPFAKVTPYLWPCDRETLCPFCWARRVSDLWRRCECAFNADGSPLYRTYTMERLVPLPTLNDLPENVSETLYYRRINRNKREYKYSKQAGDVAFLCVVRRKGAFFVRLRWLVFLKPGKNRPSIPGNVVVSDVKLQSRQELMRTLAWVLRYPKFLLDDVAAVDVLTTIGALQPLKQLICTGILRKKNAPAETGHVLGGAEIAEDSVAGEQTDPTDLPINDGERGASVLPTAEDAATSGESDSVELPINDGQPGVPRLVGRARRNSERI